MRPAARLQAAIELLDEIIDAARGNGAAADTIIKRYFSTRRYAGSKDRRAVRELVYAAVRRYGVAPFSGRAAMAGLAQDEPDLLPLFDGSDHGPKSLASNEIGALPSGVPDWLRKEFASAVDDEDVQSLTGRAPLDIRVNLGRTSREAVVQQIEGAEIGSLSVSSVRLPQGFPIEQHDLWKDGLVDIQDEGSQYIVDQCAAEPGMTIVDLCAGGGGKTLALYDRIGGNGRLIACDIDRRRLSRIAPRAERSAMSAIEMRLLNPQQEGAMLADIEGAADIVLVDAPCSGTGTWRRNPEAWWRLNERAIARYVTTQAQLLDIASPLVKPGGYLVYIVCSLLAREGEGQISDFVKARSDFSKVDAANTKAVASGDGFILTPARHGTDGFFFARLQRSC